MPIKTVYTCDRCDHSQEKPDQMWRLAVVVKPATYTANLTATMQPPKGAVWCRNCVLSIGLLVPTSHEADKKPEPAPTLEDIVRDIIEEEFDNRV